MIVAINLSHGLELVMGNTTHFQRIQRLGYPLLRVMVKRRAIAAEQSARICNHAFRATDITAHLDNGGIIEKTRRATAYQQAQENPTLPAVTAMGSVRGFQRTHDDFIQPLRGPTSLHPLNGRICKLLLFTNTNNFDCCAF